MTKSNMDNDIPESGYCKHGKNKWYIRYINGVPVKLWVNEPSREDTKSTLCTKSRPDIDRIGLTQRLTGKRYLQ